MKRSLISVAGRLVFWGWRNIRLLAITDSSYWCWKAVQAVYNNSNAEPARVIHTVFQSISPT